jgi:transposase
MRSQIPQLRKALTGRFREHYAFLLQQMLDHVERQEADITALDVRIESALATFVLQIDPLRTIPGIDRRSAEAILAEIGPDMSVFPTGAHLASRAGRCPGQRESAGKRGSGQTRKGSN